MVNHVALQYASVNLPFGGVGASGIGRYHGAYGFRELSHERAVLTQRWPPLTDLLLPPYRGRLHAVVRRVTRALSS